MTEDSEAPVPIITQPTKEILSERELVDYKSEREAFRDWLQHFGKDPEKATGYGDYTVRDTLYRADRYYRWLWSNLEKYTIQINRAHADLYMKYQARREVTADTKAGVQRAIKRLYKWLHHERGHPEWEPEITYSNSSMGNPQDFLTREERGKIREAAMEYGSIPKYNDLTPDQRDRWRLYLSRRFIIPLSEVTPEHWDRANGWKMPSLVWTSLDAGLRPVEVKRFTTEWLNLDNDRLMIPKEESSKNTENWIVPLSERTTTALEKWVDERELYDKYDGEDHLWLTREGNPYGSQALRYIMGRLFDIAEIPKENRTVSWYSIRHSTGTYMTREEDLKAAKSQLRHKSALTTMQYDQAPEGDRRKALDRMD
jgi:site-specific recombinase XerD